MSLDKKIVIEEYYMTHHKSQEQFVIRYIKHNGYTTIKPVAGQKSELSDFVKNNRVQMTRYDEPHWYKPIRFQRKYKLMDWADKTIEKARCGLCEIAEPTSNLEKGE